MTALNEHKDIWVKGKRYRLPEGMRVSSCCGANSTVTEDGFLRCKVCYEAVPTGEGDGVEYLPGLGDWNNESKD